jgi:hypothetical protein
MHHPLESWIVVSRRRDRHTGNTDCDNRRNAPIGKQDVVLRVSAYPIPDVWASRRPDELPPLLLSYRPQPRALETDFGGVYYMYQRGCLVFCAKAASQSHPLIPLLEGSAGDGATNHGAENGRFRPPQNRHGPWMPIPE